MTIEPEKLSASSPENFALVLAPRYALNLFLLPMFPAVGWLTGWFLACAIDSQKLQLM